MEKFNRVGACARPQLHKRTLRKAETPTCDVQELWDEAVRLLTHPDNQHLVLAPTQKASAAIMRACIEQADTHCAAAVFCRIEPVHDHCVLLLAVLAFSILGDWQAGSNAMARALSLPPASSESDYIVAVLARLMSCAGSASVGAHHGGDIGQAQAIACSMIAV
jgi:hypothetical protein